MAPEYLEYIPAGAGKEVVTRYEPMSRTDSEGTREDWWKYVFVYYVFGGGDLKINGTGEISLLYPSIDLWDFPATADEGKLFEYQKRAILTFQNGVLIDETINNS